MINIITVLVGLRLRNIALIESQELAFNKGLTVLTGETGAGKSILLDALDALLGGSNLSSASKLLRVGSKDAQIEATFTLSKSLDGWLQEHQIDCCENELLLSRDWRLKDERWINRCRLNGIIINRQQVLSLRPLLIDITAQGQAHYLSQSSEQLAFVDRFAGKSINSLITNVKTSWEDWKRLDSSYKEIKAEHDLFLKKSEESLSILNELEQAQIFDSEEDLKLEKEQDRLVNGVRLQDSISTIMTYLKEGSEASPSIDELLHLVIHELKLISQYDSSLLKVVDKFLDLQTAFNDFSMEFWEYSSLLESDPQRLHDVQERLSIIKRIQKIHNLNLSELICLRDQLENSVYQNNFDKQLNGLSLKLEKAIKLRDLHNKELTEARRMFANQLEEKLKNSLFLMGLSNIQFKINIETIEPTKNGSDLVTFLFSANPGHSMSPLTDVASGGEMSRFLLALKATLSQSDNSVTYIFDEIDAGVSGRISSAVANVLKDLSKIQQVFCVTHQPLIAAAADHHFSVTKTVKNGATTSKVQYLKTIVDRQSELAELAGGDIAEAKSYAASLLDHHAA